jgi:uncharacterized protein YjbJ (UPF0337 family)
MSNAKRVRHEVGRLAGQAKETIGSATGDGRLRNEGRADQAKARLRIAGERVKDAVRGK